MKEPNKIPLDPNSPKTKKVEYIPMPDISAGIDYENHLSKINKILDEISNEDYHQNNS